jgi:hypothetical protein
VNTLDNLLNPLYWALRVMSVLRLSPFFLGYTPSPRGLARVLENRGFQVFETRWLIHNPRIVSTALIRVIRMLLGRRATRPIRWMLRVFAMQEKLWPKFSGCFYAVLARKGGV